MSATCLSNIFISSNREQTWVVALCGLASGEPGFGTAWFQSHFITPQAISCRNDVQNLVVGRSAFVFGLNVPEFVD